MTLFHTKMFGPASASASRVDSPTPTTPPPPLHYHPPSNYNLQSAHSHPIREILSHKADQVGGVKVDELNGMETEFLFLISFDLHIKRSDYDAFVSELYTRAHATEDFSRRVAGLSIRTSPSGATASAPPWEGPRSPYMIQQAGGGAPPGHPAAVTPISGHPWGPEMVSPNLQGGPMQVGPSGGLTAGGPQGMLQQQQGVGGGGAGGAGGGVGGGGGAPPPPPPQREMPREMQVPSPHILTGSGVNYAPHVVRFASDLPSPPLTHMFSPRFCLCLCLCLCSVSVSLCLCLTPWSLTRHTDHCLFPLGSLSKVRTLATATTEHLPL
jgi:hypothetical protein